MPTTTERSSRARPGGEDDTRKPSVLAIVVSHRGRRWLKDCLVSLNTQTYDLLDVLVIDDASPDFRVQPHLKRVCKRHLKRRRWGWVRTPRVLGFGGAINWALARVRTDADLFLFVHDDTIFDPSAVEKMVERAYAERDTAIIGPKIVAYDDPDRLEEIGMAVDRFGYPYKGLEEGEIDLGQHDVASEVFYVTSTCLMIKHQVFSDLGGWDGGMRAFSEDLDLCWRARVAGHQVRVEPLARVRHAMALATAQRESPFTPSRYFIRRNRMRAVVKNVSVPRLTALAPQLTLLAVAEMLGFLVLRLPSESLNVLRALLWNVATLPRTFADRWKVQATRAIGDRSLKRLTVRESTRVRAYAEHQAARLEEAWGRRAELVAERSRQARRATGTLAGSRGVAIAAAALLLLLGFRNAFTGEPAAAGDLLPFPGKAFDLWSAYLSPWLHSGLGHPWPSPPAFGLLGWFSFLSFGDAGAAQKLALLVFGIIAFVGAYRLVGDSVDRSSRLVAGGVYLLGGVGYAGMRNGHLSALVLGAAAPFVLRSLLTLIGWQRPPGFRPASVIAQAVLAAAIAASFVPGSLVFFAATAVILAIIRSVVDRPVRAVGGLGWGLLALVLAWGLLLPWSLTWFHEGGAISMLIDQSTRSAIAASYSDSGFLPTVLGRVPYLPALGGLALPVAGAVALFVARGQRFRLAIALWAVVVAIAWFVQAIASGVLVPLVASPIEAGALASLAFAGLAGIATSAMRLDLSSTSLGYRQPLGVGAALIAGALALTGLVPALVGGGYSLKPQATDRAAMMSQAGSLLSSESGKNKQSRVLWVGRSWTGGLPTSTRPQRDFLLTSSDGETITDLFESSQGPGEAQLESAVDAIESGRVDLGGSLLGAFNIRWVVVSHSTRASEWLAQRDLTVVRTDPGYDLLENPFPLARAGTYGRLPAQVATVAGSRATAVASKPSKARGLGQQTSTHSYSIPSSPAARVAFLAETSDPGWRAVASGKSLEPIRGTWGNAFALPAGASQVDVVFRRPVSQVVWLIVIAIGWLVVVGVSFARHREGAA